MDMCIIISVIIFIGVIIGLGATLVASTMVAKDVVPYSLTGGVPAKFIKFKWTIDEIIEHEKRLYPESERFTRDYLEKIFAEHNKK